MNKKNSATEVISPSWSGSGDDLFDAIQVLKNREIHDGYLEIDIVFKFSDTFEYPLVFEIKSSDSVVESIAIAFNIPKKDKTKWAIEERIIGDNWGQKRCISRDKDELKKLRRSEVLNLVTSKLQNTTGLTLPYI